MLQALVLVQPEPVVLKAQLLLILLSSLKLKPLQLTLLLLVTPQGAARCLVAPHPKLLQLCLHCGLQHPQQPL
jgi:hypothetical protein